MQKKRLSLALAAAALFLQLPAFACTSIIISGKATPDGRPLMWKNRDTKTGENHVQFFPAENGSYAFTGIVSSGAKGPGSVWLGTNSEGFSVMNTLSYNIASEEDKNKKGGNGAFMKLALSRCASIADFEALLDTLPKPWKLKANIGVTDAKGGAAYYEINFSEYFKYDVNEAPSGWIVRSNYSLAGRPVAEGVGHVRFMEAERLAAAADSFAPEYILTNMSRSYANPLLGTDYRDESWKGEWALEHDIITRYTSTCSVVIQGVKPGEDPALTTMWTIVGYPGTTVAMPVWESQGENGIPTLLQRSEKGRSELSHWGLKLKKRAYCYDLDNRNENKYFKWALLWNKDGNGWLQQILRFEPELLEPYRKALDRWREAGRIDGAELKALNAEACDAVRAFYAGIL